MSDRFALRFVLAAGRPTHDAVAPLWADEGVDVTRDPDGVLHLSRDGAPLAHLDLLLADEGRGRAVLGALSGQVRGSDEASESVRFALEHAVGVVIARPVFADEASIEPALDALDPLWAHLFEAHGGLLQVDGEGFHDEDGLVVEA